MKGMKIKCQESSCSKKARELYKGKYVCKRHTCRCNDPKDSWHEGCFLHKA